MKPWQLSRRVGNLSEQIDDSAESETRIDLNCLTEAERMLFEEVDEIIDKYSPGRPPRDVIEKNADLWSKGLEIFARRATELFVYVMPASLCCDELEEWYFKIYFHNFMLDWLDQVDQLRKMPKEKRDALFAERKEMGMLDMVFRLKRYPPPTLQKQNEGKEQES
ncbi:MAG: hypothetical protein ABSD92_07335 [Candidatus Bathyarchaeia archaeon]